MQIPWKIMVLGLIWGLFWATGAAAMPFHHGAVFHQKSGEAETLRPNCPMSHQRTGLPCPHAHKNHDGKKCILQTECGSKSFPSLSFSNTPLPTMIQSALSMPPLHWETGRALSNGFHPNIRERLNLPDPPPKLFLLIS